MFKSKIKALLFSQRHKRITRAYPFAPLKPPENLRGRLDIIADKCLGCGNCVRTCPSRLISIENTNSEKIIVFSAGRCIYCGRCASACPEKAIQITHEFELATDNKKDLEIAIHLKMVNCLLCNKPFIVENLLTKQISKLKDKSEDVIKNLQICSECKKRIQEKGQ